MRDIRVSIEMTFSLTYNAPFFQLKSYVQEMLRNRRQRIGEALSAFLALLALLALLR
jgi:hypothetical protein